VLDIKVIEDRFSTHRRIELLDFTSKLNEVVEKHRLEEGIVMVFLPHATAAVTANENEPGLVEDIIDVLTKIAPPDGSFRHNLIDDNAHAHILSAIVKSFYVFPVKRGRVIRGTWQNLFIVELDGPRHYRRIVYVLLGKFKQ